ncbi:MAG: MoaD/ThiS family protein [Spirochaetes bacterium]|nr:MoaD/ThiS family protein [Spirochaetota bacterium]
MIFGNKRDSAEISVELKIFGFIDGEYLSVIGHLSAPDNSTLAGLLKRARLAGMITGALCRRLASTPPDISVLINGEPLDPMSRRAVRIHAGDSVSFFSASRGG